MKNIKNAETVIIENCPICNSKNKQDIYSEKTSIKLYEDVLLFDRTFSICKECNSVYISRLLPKKTIALVYKSGIINSSVTHTEENHLNKTRYGFIMRNINKKGKLKVCDIGCNTGNFLLNFDKNKWERFGVEISEIASDISRKRLNGNVHCINWESTNYNNKFDLITILHTLEHSYNPNKFLKKCNNALKSDGYLFLEIPVFNDIRYKTINPYNQTHTFCPSINSVIFLLEKNGFYIDMIEEEKSEEYESKIMIIAKKETPYNFIKEEKKQCDIYRKYLVEYIKNTLLQWSSENKSIYVYGAGNNSVDILKDISDKDWNKINIISFLDLDEKKIGGNIFNIPILKFGEDISPDCIMILSKLGIENNMREQCIQKYPHCEIALPFHEVKQKLVNES